MSTAYVCPQCGKPVPGDSPQGLCPACLLGVVLGGESDVFSAATVPPDSVARAASAPEAGTRVRYIGDYELLEEIARGGMGVVWKARQTSLKRDVAVKMIRNGALAGPEEVARFLREAEAAANLQHPNIVAIHEVGEHGGQHYFSMDYVAGRDLESLLKNGPLSPQRAARYVNIIALAVHFAHQRGTLHRDLKPQNVLIDSADQPRITDFGLAKFMKADSGMTQSGAVMGTPSYMPPEQAAGRHGDVGPASDVYSLGAILYELVTGRPPFRASSAMSTLLEVLETEPTAPRRLKADIPPDLETICLKCLEKSPSARYPSAQALAEELDRFLKSEPIQARPASALRKMVSWARRHPGVLAAVTSLVVIALAIGVFYLVEENAFLRARLLDSTLARVRGPRHESLILWSLIGYLAAFAGFVLWFTLNRQSRGLSWRDNRPGEFLVRPLQPLRPGIWTFALGASLILIGYGVVLLAMTIQASVWEGESIANNLAAIWFLVYAGLLTLLIIIRDYRLLNYGISGPLNRELSEQQLEPIRQALLDKNWAAAVNCYREAVPGASAIEAHRYLLRLSAMLGAGQPGQVGPSPLSLRTVNWNAVLICAVIEAAVLGVLWLAIPPASPASAVPRFVSGLLLGMGSMAAGRAKSSRLARLLFLALVLIFVGETNVPRLAGSSRGPIAVVYILAVFCGTLLTMSAAIPGRRRA
jgi:hypothetical protein